MDSNNKIPEQSAELLVIQQIKEALNISETKDLFQIHEEINSLKQVIERQAEKIRRSQKEAERIGYELRLELNKSVSKIRELDVLVNRLKPWHAMGGSLLGDTPELAAQEFYRLKSYEHAMNSPLHKLVSRLTRLFKTILRADFFKKLLKLMTALRKA